eukprot:CAMPEP_0170525358 /NCGR_PEP_ID=MMETSP0209-20121228/10865_1 /TAXON_ID=665100 ORGANISM="Litonotus pictus, Strain P1" /NCGR_SAMPLE_ID=MMETSP0209 /ASSEMBLY_ACC=CAM_ASM_000301 /LENGTH=183 /DNA_ID=CAMNT_0010814601 /DNA_START=425 /DNA_END=972 /DNA_ORIENTATION=+
MYSQMGKAEFDSMANLKVLNEYHTMGVTLEKYKKTVNYKNFFKVTTTGKDREGKEYINSIEAYNYNIFAVQHHPEKTAYDLRLVDAAASSIQSNMVSKGLGNALIYYASQSEDIRKELTGNVKLMFELAKSEGKEDIIVFNYLNRISKLTDNSSKDMKEIEKLIGQSDSQNKYSEFKLRIIQP